MDKFLTNFAKSVAIVPSAPRRRRSSTMPSTRPGLPEAKSDKEFSEIRGQIRGPKKNIEREMY